MFNLHAAKTHLSRLVDEAVEGKEIVIAKAGRPLVRLVPIEAGRRRRRFGDLKDQIWMSDDFDELPDDVARGFGVDPDEERAKRREFDEKRTRREKPTR